MTELVDAIKTLAEMCGVFYKHLKKQGFANKEALILTQAYLQTTLKPRQNNQQQNTNA